MVSNRIQFIAQGVVAEWIGDDFDEVEDWLTATPRSFGFDEQNWLHAAKILVDTFNTRISTGSCGGISVTAEELLEFFDKELADFVGMLAGHADEGGCR